MTILPEISRHLDAVIKEQASEREALRPSDATTCSADVRRRIMQRADQLGRELTPEETALILASDVYAHRNWHNLGSAETTMVEMLVRAGYLTKCSQGFTGGPSLPNERGLATAPQWPDLG